MFIWYFLVQFELQKPADVFLCVRISLTFWIKQDCMWILPVIMPGHDHSLVPKLKPGDLGTREAFFLWNCPIKDEGLSIRQHVIG